MNEANPGKPAPRAAVWLRRWVPALLVALPLTGPAPWAAAQPGSQPEAPPAGEVAPAGGGEAAAPQGGEPAGAEGADGPHAYLDPLERDTPRGALGGFLRAARAGRWEEAARYLDLSALPEAEREERGPLLARHLKRVIDRSLWIDLEGIADRPEGDLGEEGVGRNRERVGFIPLPGGGRAAVLLERGSEDGERVWRVASATVERVPELYEELGYGVLDEWLPAPFFDWSFAEIQLWQWIGLALLLLVCWALSWLLARLAMKIIQPLARRSVTTIDDQLLENGAAPLRFLIGLGLFTLGVLALRLAVPAERFFVRTVQALVVVAVIYLAFRLVDIFSHWSRDRLMERGQVSAIGMLPLARKTFKVFLMTLGVLAVMQNLGVNVTALITGLGVGGLAIALAAQKSIENLFGGMTLVVDQPVRVGDFCRFGDQVGTVETVGLRSTRIRTLDRTLVTIPNAQFSEMKLETFAARDRIRLILQLGLRYETTPDQMRYVLVELRKVLYAHPRVLEDPARVRFVGFGASSLDLEVFAYADTTDFNEFLAIREDVFLRIMDVIEASGTGFAFPSQTLYMERGAGPDPERTREAEARVAAWRERGELQLPHFTREEIDALDDTLDYPPTGSAWKPPEERGGGGGER
jgi:MscS family membrane protein